MEVRGVAQKKFQQAVLKELSMIYMDILKNSPKNYGYP